MSRARLTLLRVTPASRERQNSAVAVERAADLLFLIAERGEASLTDLARAIGSTGSAVHRILTALKKKGLIQQTTENGPYSMAWSIFVLTQQLSARADLRRLSRPFMMSLRDQTGETVTLNVRSGFDRICIDQVEGLHEVRWHQQIGQISPLYTGATGKALLAFLSDDDLKEYFRTVKLRKVTPYTIVKRSELMAELAVIKKRGYATGTQDRVLGVAAMAAPIFDAAGTPAASLTIAGPLARCSSESLGEWARPLTEATRELSEMAAAAMAGSEGAEDGAAHAGNGAGGESDSSLASSSNS
jgi:IclR family transcriptional regulator, acetate operon repressor